MAVRGEWPRPDPGRVPPQARCCRRAGLADPVGIVDAQRRELLRRLREAQRAAHGRSRTTPNAALAAGREPVAAPGGPALAGGLRAELGQARGWIMTSTGRVLRRPRSLERRSVGCGTRACRGQVSTSMSPLVRRWPSWARAVRQVHPVAPTRRPRTADSGDIHASGQRITTAWANAH